MSHSQSTKVEAVLDHPDQVGIIVDIEAITTDLNVVEAVIANTLAIKNTQNHANTIVKISVAVFQKKVIILNILSD